MEIIILQTSFVASPPYFKPLHQLAAIFVEEILGFLQVNLIRYSRAMLQGKVTQVQS
jgi:hypothetical protein